MLDKVTGAAEGEGFKKLLEVITSVIAGLEKAIDLYNRLPDFGKLLINPAGQLAPLAGAAGKLYGNIGNGSFGAPQTTVNNFNIRGAIDPQTTNNYYNIKGAIDPQATARTIVKVTNTATKTTGLTPFNFGFR